jgi:hypothetical protein
LSAVQNRYIQTEIANMNVYKLRSNRKCYVFYRNVVSSRLITLSSNNLNKLCWSIRNSKITSVHINVWLQFKSSLLIRVTKISTP